MEKRLVLFLVCSVLIMTGYGFLRVQFGPPPQRMTDPVDAEIEEPKQASDDIPDADDQPPDAERPDGGSESTSSGQQLADDPESTEQAAATPVAPTVQADRPPGGAIVPEQRVTLGSFAPESPYRLLVVLNNRGASVERVELVERHSNGSLRYRDLTQRHGYLGISYQDTEQGCELTVVGPGTPAALAQPADNSVDIGLQAGDLIRRMNDRDILSCNDLERALETIEAGQTATLFALRPSGNQGQLIEFSAKLTERPLNLIQPEAPGEAEPTLSYLLGIQRLGGRQARFDQDELNELFSLRDGTWHVEKSGENEVVFRQRVAFVTGEQETSELEFIKRFRLVETPQAAQTDHSAASYHLEMLVEIHNLSQQPQTLTFNLDGPTGLPTEGWWYSNKIHPSWGSAGARDVIWRVHEQRHSLRSASEIYEQWEEDPDDPVKSILTDNPTPEQRTLDYLGVDTQYFSAVLMAGSVTDPEPFRCQQAYAMPVKPVEELDGRAVKTVNTTFRYLSEQLALEPNEQISQAFHLFLGPKSPELLAEYGLSDIIEYGWFGWIAKPLGQLLDIFYMFVRNYGLAIVLLTILVRGCMFPIGRKAARNAQMMQELAPEIKKIKEKYKNDMEKQAQAQRELWKKHNFNPLGGCWLMFLQLPIFIGLYRCLSVDIELRQAPLIPGLDWASNLAGPDMLLYWNTSGLEFLTSKTGWLGPYLNVLPIVTVVLFLLQQKMFTPPATDDQSRMQQKMMKYMMIFMGVLFFKVPSGLCIYFIASSLWGIAERKLLPKPDVKSTTDTAPKKGAVKSLVERIKEKVEPESGEDIRARRKKRRK